MTLKWYREDALAQRENLCFECESKECALNGDGICCYPLVHGRKPVITEEDGCTEMSVF